ncbi:Vacuolar basic amino acid transporter 1 [Ceratocystis lukuohia]|uniref:Vacuolar basic amino acid transporter 1 n=1 Tax=Ceratocystis lukuohia TaxID=2019550 RepID=A0ABR4MU49_9PEZI
MIQSKVAEDLDADEEVMWFAGAYLIALSALTPVIGRLATIFAPRNIVVPVSLLVAAGSAITASATAFARFTVGRLISKERRGMYMALVNMGFTAGLSFGAIMYGALLPCIGWRAIFWAQALVSVAAGAGVYLSVPESSQPRKKLNDGMSAAQKLASIDYVGVVALTTTISLFLYALIGDIRPYCIALSFVFLGVFVLWECRFATDPIIPLKILSSKDVLYTCFAQLIFVSTRWSLLYYGPIFMLVVKSFSPSVSGSILIPTNIGFGGGGLLIGWLHIRHHGSFWLSSVLSLAIFCLTLVLVASSGSTSSPTWLFVLYVFLNGLATGGGVNYTLAHMLHLTSPDVHFVSTSLLGMFRGFGGSFGTAIGGGYFMRLLKSLLTEGFARLDGGVISPRHEDLVVKLAGRPSFVFDGGLSANEETIARNGYAAALQQTWRMAALVGLAAIVLQGMCGWRAPDESNEAGDGDIADNERSDD